MPRRVCTFAVAHTDISAQPFNNAARTVRIFAPNNLSGSAVYVKFSNYYSDGPVWVGNATIGLADAKGRLVPDTVRPLTVHGDTSFALVPQRDVFSDRVALPVQPGCTMHMDGSVLSSITKIAFLYGVFGMDFSGAGTYGMAIVVAILSAFVLSGAPGGGLVGEMLIVSMFNFPAEAFPIIATLGFLFDPAATCLNASGDTIASMLVTRLVEGKEWLAKAAAAKKSRV